MANELKLMQSIQNGKILNKLKSISENNGFQLFGIAEPKIPKNNIRYVIHWIRNKYHGNMKWMEKNLFLKFFFHRLGFKVYSVIVLGSVYSSSEYESFQKKSKLKISRYALGKDYHKVLREKASPLLNFLKIHFPKNHFRQSVDSLPILEKVLAVKSGIGWMGKNTMIINKSLGSYFFITTILTDLDLLPFTTSSLETDRCGNCRKCIEACPTNALSEYEINASKCISYQTIEQKTETPSETSNWIFGCDICQEVCPWNFKIAKNNQIETSISDFHIQNFFQINHESNYTKINEKDYERLTKDLAISRINFNQFKRNINQNILEIN